MQHTCPCCGYKTLDAPARGTYEICPLCYWEDDPVQHQDPDYAGGANELSLREAQHLFVNKAGDCEAYSKDPGWNLLAPPSEASRLKHSKTDFIANREGTVEKL